MATGPRLVLNDSASRASRAGSVSGSGTPSRGSRRTGTAGASGTSASGASSPDSRSSSATSVRREGDDALRRQTRGGAQQVDERQQVRGQIGGVGGPGRAKFDGHRRPRPVQVAEARRGGLGD